MRKVETSRSGAARGYLSFFLGKSSSVCLLILLSIVLFVPASADYGVLTSLYSFSGPDGAGPTANLVQGSDGNFYGVTIVGGADSFCAGGGCSGGAIFKITPSGTLTTLHSFAGPDGDLPNAALVQGLNGNFYGTASSGGTSGGCGGDYCGTVFEISPAGTFATLHFFDGSDGDYPGPMVLGSDGNLYGATLYGGASGNGTIFKMTPDGVFSTLYSLGEGDGQDTTSIIKGSDGNFYGTAGYGGTYGYGTIFKVTPGGVFSIIYSFTGTADGLDPSGIVQGSDGNFYGTTAGYPDDLGCGGAFNCGTVFKLTPEGDFTTLYTFGSASYVGKNPNGLIQGSNGNFYGTTAYGGDDVGVGYDGGTIFEITANGTFTTLYAFAGIYGYNPTASVIQASDGYLYGTTQGGGSGDQPGGAGGTLADGTVFKLSVVSGLPLPAPTNLTATASPGEVTLTWAPVSGALGYYVYWATVPGAEGSTFVTTEYPTYSNSYLTNGTEYYFKVAASNASGIGPMSAEVSVTPVAPAVPAPTFSPAGGTYTSKQVVAIVDTYATSFIYYTTDGTTPTAASSKYTGAIKVSKTTTLKAIAVLIGYTNSAVSTVTYTITRSRR